MAKSLMSKMMVGWAVLAVLTFEAGAQEEPDMWAGGDPDFCESCEGVGIIADVPPDETMVDEFDPAVNYVAEESLDDVQIDEINPDEEIVEVGIVGEEIVVDLSPEGWEFSSVGFDLPLSVDVEVTHAEEVMLESASGPIANSESSPDDDDVCAVAKRASVKAVCP